MSDFRLRRYVLADEDAALALWQRTWQAAYPDIDFAARLDWWRTRWRNELVPTCTIVVADDGAASLAGFVTVNRDDGDLDQLVAAPEHWGSGVAALLMSEAKRIAPAGLHLTVNRDNARALAFYRKQGFFIAGESTNPNSGRPTYRMTWQPADARQ